MSTLTSCERLGLNETSYHFTTCMSKRTSVRMLENTFGVGFPILRHVSARDKT